VNEKAREEIERTREELEKLYKESFEYTKDKEFLEKYRELQEKMKKLEQWKPDYNSDIWIHGKEEEITKKEPIKKERRPKDFVGEFYFDVDTGKMYLNLWNPKTGKFEKIEIKDVNDIKKIITKKMLKSS